MNVPTDVLLYMHAVHICIKYEKNVVTLHKATIYDFCSVRLEESVRVRTRSELV